MCRRFHVASLYLCLCAALACSQSKSKEAPAADSSGPAATQSAPATASPAPPASPAPMDPATNEPSDPYTRDVYRICHAETLSGAMKLDEGARPVQVAQWLGANVMTEDGRQFLASIARASSPEAKMEVLRTETGRVGLGDCPLIKAWSGGR